MPETSLRDDLAAGFSGAETDPPAIDPGVTDSTTAPPDGGASGEPVALSPPQHWAEADRTLFATAPREIQQRWLAREDEVQKGFSKHGQELSQFKKDREAWDGIFKDRDQHLTLNGITRHQLVQQLVAWNDFLSKDPAAGLRQMAERLGVDLKTLIENPQATTDPKLRELSEKYEKLHSQMDARERREREDRQKRNLEAMDAFANAKDADGKPLHPYFDDVLEDMARLARADGRLSLETLYKQAVRINDAVFQKAEAARIAAANDKQERERKANVEKARRAAAGSSGEGGATTTPKTLRDDLAAGFAAWPA